MPAVHCKKEEYDVYIGRPSPWGNPFSDKDGTLARFQTDSREESIEAYRQFLWKQIRSGEVSLTALAALDGKRLGCWCAPKSCHGDVLIAAARWAREKIESADK